jgi:hypothetical protein
VDEPFTHLDELRSAEVWRLLSRISAERQVIVTTQDRLVLEHLGVEPDIRLSGAEETDGTAPESSVPAGHVAAPDAGARGPSGSTGVEGDDGTREPSRSPPGDPDAGAERDERDVPEQAQLELG